MRRRPSPRLAQLVAQVRAVREASAFEGYDVVVTPRASAPVEAPTSSERDAQPQPQAVR